MRCRMPMGSVLWNIRNTYIRQIISFWVEALFPFVAFTHPPSSSPLLPLLEVVQREAELIWAPNYGAAHKLLLVGDQNLLSLWLCVLLPESENQIDTHF